MTPDEWRDRIAELRELAENTADLRRKRRYLELADRWSEFVEELEESAGAFQQPQGAADEPEARGLMPLRTEC